jgi:hypothetical protein
MARVTPSCRSCKCNDITRRARQVGVPTNNSSSVNPLHLVSEELREEIFVEQLDGWFIDERSRLHSTSRKPTCPKTSHFKDVFCSK